MDGRTELRLLKPR